MLFVVPVLGQNSYLIITLTYFYPSLQPILSWFAISQNPNNLLKFRRPSEKRIAKSAQIKTNQILTESFGI